jgi:hypothetical protein
MKKLSIITAAALGLLFSCSNPLFKWVEIPEAPAARILVSDKVITGFSTGIPGEAVEIQTQPRADSGDKTPIIVILPPGSSAGNIAPAVTYEGKSLSPPSGQAQNFLEPVTYTVTGQDNTQRDYEVTVIVRTNSSKDILWFDLALPGTGSLLAEGVVTENLDETSGSVVIRVPNNVTSLESLTAKVVHTGKSIGWSGGGYTGSTVTFPPGNFSSPQTYYVTAQDNSVKTYQVTVVRELSDSKEITAFSFSGVSGQTIISAVPQQNGKIPVLVTLPKGTGLTSLQPVITHTGKTVSPGEAQNFSTPVTYTVTAENGTTREYEVTVLPVDNTSKQLTGFYIPLTVSPATEAEGIINETAKTVAVTVPYGTNLQALAPTVYHTGASVSPVSGALKDFRNSPVPYTVTARDGTTAVYQVYLDVTANNAKAITGFVLDSVPGAVTAIGSTPSSDGKLPIVITVPSGTNAGALTPRITHTGNSIAGAGLPGIGPQTGAGTVTAGSTVNFNSPVTYTVTAEDGSAQAYSVTLIKEPDSSADNIARIDAFYFTNPLALGVITGTNITVTVPYGTDTEHLIPAIHFSGQSIKQGAGGDVTDNPAYIGADFSNTDSTPVPYTVTAVNSSTQDYEVTVNVAPSSAKEITALHFSEVTEANTITVIGSAPVAGKYPIEVTLPLNSGLTSLTPKITHTGVSISGPGLPGTGGSPGTVTAVNLVSFSSPVTYRVTAEDNTWRDYLVTVRELDLNAKEITGFYFTDPLAVGVINQTAKTITVTVPYGTDLSALVPTVHHTGVSLSPASGKANNFASPATYRVTAANGTVQPYTVTVYPARNSAKEITAFSFPSLADCDTVIGALPGADGTIPIVVTVPENANLSALAPAITHTGETLSPGSGEARNFNNPVFYRVTAEDGSYKDYTVQCHRRATDNRIITGFIVTLSPGNVVVGSIDQETRTIAVTVPYDTNVTGLSPTITYMGYSLAPPTGQGTRANPFIDNPQNFTSPQVYRVTAVNGDHTDYTVTVTPESQKLAFSVTFLGVTDPTLITETFDAETGTLTLEINENTAYEAPYEWYLDGRRYPASTTATSLTLNVGDLNTGQHELVLVVTETAQPKLHYTNKIYFLVHE